MKKRKIVIDLTTFRSTLKPNQNFYHLGYGKVAIGTGINLLGEACLTFRHLKIKKGKKIGTTVYKKDLDSVFNDVLVS